MKQIDRLRAMSTDELAAFLCAADIDILIDYCGEACKQIQNDNCSECPYATAAGNRQAWRNWLNMEIPDTPDTAEYIQVGKLLNDLDARTYNGEELPPMSAGDFIKLVNSQPKYSKP